MIAYERSYIEGCCRSCFRGVWAHVETVAKFRAQSRGFRAHVAESHVLLTCVFVRESECAVHLPLQTMWGLRSKSGSLRGSLAKSGLLEGTLPGVLRLRAKDLKGLLLRTDAT